MLFNVWRLVSAREIRRASLPRPDIPPHLSHTVLAKTPLICCIRRFGGTQLPWCTQTVMIVRWPRTLSLSDTRTQAHDLSFPERSSCTRKAGNDITERVVSDGSIPFRVAVGPLNAPQLSGLADIFGKRRQRR